MHFLLLSLLVVLVPVGVWFVLRRRLPAWLSPPLYALVMSIVLYIVIVLGAMFAEEKAESDLLNFDRTHARTTLTDGQQQERHALFLNVIHDTGRTFAPFTAGIASIVYLLVIWLCIHGVERIARYRA